LDPSIVSKLQGEKVLFDNRLPAERLYIQGEYQGVDFSQL
jgi:hypothetical protein